jgi:hypothetical protein
MWYWLFLDVTLRRLVDSDVSGQHICRDRYTETSVNNYQSTLKNIPEERRSRLSFPSSKVKQSIAWPLMMEPIGCTETSVTNYQSTLRNIPEERSHLSLVDAGYAAVTVQLSQNGSLSLSHPLSVSVTQVKGLATRFYSSTKRFSVVFQTLAYHWQADRTICGQSHAPVKHTSRRNGIAMIRPTFDKHIRKGELAT